MKEFKQEILDTLGDFKAFGQRVQSRKDILRRELSKIDGKKNDLLHLIEGVCDSSVHFTRIYRELKEILIERRSIKDEYEVLQALVDSPVISQAAMNKVIKRVEGAPKHYTNRHYSNNFKELVKENREDDNNGETQE